MGNVFLNSAALTVCLFCISSNFEVLLFFVFFTMVSPKLCIPYHVHAGFWPVVL